MYFTTNDITNLIKHKDISIDEDGNIFFESFTIPNCYSTGLVVFIDSDGEKQHYSDEIEINFQYDGEPFYISHKQLEKVRNHVRDLAFENKKEASDTSSAFTTDDRLHQVSLIN